MHEWTGIPNCIGIAPTNTLAKLAKRVGKAAVWKPGSYPAGLAWVCAVAALSPTELDAVLRATAVGDLWGVGRRLGARLQARGVSTAADLRDAAADDLLAKFGMVMARTPPADQAGTLSLHGLKHRDTADTVVNRGDKQDVAGHVTPATIGRYDDALPVVERQSAADFPGNSPAASIKALGTS